MSEDGLAANRRLIDEADQVIAKGFEDRFRAAARIAAYKESRGLPTCDPKREEQLLERNLQLVKDERLKKYYRRFLQEILALSKEYQEELRSCHE